MSNKEKMTIDWAKVARLGITLFLISAVCTLFLALTNNMTKDVIAKRNEDANVKARQVVIKDADKFKKVEDLENSLKALDLSEVKEVYIAYKGDKVVGYTVKTAPKGYGGPIEMLTGISVEGKIEGITIIALNETPGLGAKANLPEFTDQYAGKDAKKPLEVIKGGAASDTQIAAITGATITSKAVTSGVNIAQKVAEEIAKEGN